VRYVIHWQENDRFLTLPAHEYAHPGDVVYVSKDAATNAAVNILCQKRSELDHAIKIARKKLERMDRRQGAHA